MEEIRDETTEEQSFKPQYPAELYTKRPNDTALLSPIYDYTFKGIFTQDTEESNLALRCFLSAVLNRKISKVTLKPNEPVVETSEQKKMIFDVSVEFDNGELADIEMQARSQNYNYGVRAEIMAARLLTNNAKQGQDWAASKVYQISVLNFHYKNNDKKEMRWYTMSDDSNEKLEERLNIIFIDLVTIRKLKDKPVNQLTPLEKWGLFFSYVDKENAKDYINSIIESEQGIMEAEKIVKTMSESDDNWFVQNSLWVAERDRTASLVNAKKQGLEEGIQQGLQQGIQQKAEEDAIALLKEEIPVETIARSVKLPIEEILELQKSLSKEA
ncbi:MAG: Rpn family recombination-promoting nuclease/putative transposase [Treponema sp.]|nr:Rpn family recombination-promoting nuclease/putative transposase [Treponema sp.]